MAHSPRVSIILPTYNGAQRISRAIESVIAQGFREWELIIIDDGSTDTTQDSIKSFAQSDTRIKYYKNEHNLGIQKTLNKGLSIAVGEYVARIDDDDIWIRDDKLAQQVAFLDMHADYVLIGTNAQIVDDKGKVLETYSLPQHDTDIRTRILLKNCFLHPTIVMRTHAVQRVGGYSEAMGARHIEDYALWLALGTIGKFANLRDITARLTVHAGSTTFKNRIVQARHILAFIGLYKEKYPRFIRAYIVIIVRILGFSLMNVVPIPQSLLYRIQKIYKEF